MVLLGSSLALVASLYLPWQRASCVRGCADRHTFGLLRLDATNDLDGWPTAFGSATAVFALVLAGLCAVGVARPGAADRLPYGRAALLSAYGAVAVFFGARSDARLLG